MPRKRSGTAEVLVGLILSIVSGCGGNQAPSPQAIQEGPIRDVGTIYRMYSADRQKPPEKPDDFKIYEQAYPHGYKAVKDGAVVVNWGAKLTDLSEEGGQESSDEVLAYEKEVPENGGNVLMKNRTIRTMTPDEFKATKQAGKG